MLPKVYFGLHMVEGVAEYRPLGQSPYRVFVGEEAIKKMDRTFQGRPVYVGHVDGVEEGELGKGKEDGYVIRSFLNKADGKHWAEFLVTTERGHEAIRNGWKLSNCYNSTESRAGGQWHGVDYQKEVMNAEYEHLAIVRTPRYEESVIMTPEEFKRYNEKLEADLYRMANEKENNKKEKNSMFKFFKRERVENSADLESVVVELPKSKKQMTVAEVLTKYDERIANGYHCNGEEMVKVGEKNMMVNELVSQHLEAQEKMMGMEKAMNEMKEEEEKKKNSLSEEEKKKNEMAEEEKKKNALEEEEKKKNALKEEEEKKQQNSKEQENFKRVMNAVHESKKNAPQAELSMDRVARGKARYGSKK